MKSSVFLYSEGPSHQLSDQDYPLNALAPHRKSLLSAECPYVKHYTKEDTYIRFAPSPKQNRPQLDESLVTSANGEP